VRRMYKKSLEISITDLASLFVPDEALVRRLRCIPEYRDEYDPVAQRIRITEVIPDGCYHHVLNCLCLLSKFVDTPVFRCVGIDRRCLTATIVFHDVGKVQPVLDIGDVVSPAEVFEDGKIHALRSAAFASSHYNVSPVVETLIQYHHHLEKELPPGYPETLKPAHRLLRLIDGLSAAVTRRGADITLHVEGTRVFVQETNPHPGYNGCRVVDIATGAEIITTTNKQRG